jgi:predicted metal-binding protein
VTDADASFDQSELRDDFRDEEFWARETPRFLSYARSVVLRHPSRGSYGDEPQDYVVRAAALILEGQRRCPPDVPSVPFVMGVIRSLVTHDAEKPEHRRLHTAVTNDDSEDEGVIHEEQLADRRAPAIDELLTADDLARDFVSSLPEEYRSYVELLISGSCSAAAECAERLGVTEAQVRLMDKAIRRRRRLWKGAPPR